jgi:hypothetical protein
MTSRLRSYLASAAVQHTPGELALLALSERRADNSNAVGRALVEPLAGHPGVGQSSRVARLTVVAKGK